MKEVIYGFPCVEDPHDFTPDTEICTPEEIAFWEDAKKRWEAGERNVRGARCTSTYDDAGKRIMHTTQTSWGIGVNMVEMDDDEEDDSGPLTNPGASDSKARTTIKSLDSIL